MMKWGWTAEKLPTRGDSTKPNKGGEFTRGILQRGITRHIYAFLAQYPCQQWQDLQAVGHKMAIEQARGEGGGW